MEIDQLVTAPEASGVVETADAKPPHEQFVAEEHVAEAQGEHQDNESSDVEPILTSLHLTGVDDLSTQQIKRYIDHHIKPNYSFSTRKQYSHLEYRLDWINDSEINVVFDRNLSNKKESRGKNPNRRNSGMDLFYSKGRHDEDSEMNEANERQEIPEEEDTTDNTLQDLKSESIRGAAEALLLLTDFVDIRNEHSEFAALTIEDQIKAVEQAPKLQDRKCWDLILTKNGEVIKTRDARDFYNLFERVIQGKTEQEEIVPNEDGTAASTIVEDPTEQEVFPEESKTIKVEVRYSTSLDRKVENARVFSRYYLLHGEPDKIERLPPARERSREEYSNFADYETDLITAAKPETQGIFGYDDDRDERELTDSREREWENSGRGIRGKWSSDRYFGQNYGRDPGYRVSKGGNARGRQSGGGSRRDRRRRDRDNAGGQSRNQLGADLFPGFAAKNH